MPRRAARGGRDSQPDQALRRQREAPIGVVGLAAGQRRVKDADQVQVVLHGEGVAIVSVKRIHRPRSDCVTRAVGKVNQRGLALFGDLIADYNRALDSQCIIGTGANNQLLGLDTVTGVNAVTSVQASPTVALVLPRIADAIQQVNTGRFMPADGILMHPRRWGWILAATDTAGRPLVDAEGSPMNAVGISDVPKAEGSVGSLAGLPVYVDANIPTTITSNQDEIYVARFSDGLLFESAPRTEVFRDVGSANATARLRIYAFCNLFAGRYPAGISRIGGTGLAIPSFGT